MSRITRAAQRLTDGDYDARVDVVTGDELGQLAITFNEMADALAASRARGRPGW